MRTVVSAFCLEQVRAAKNEARDAVAELLGDAGGGFAGTACSKSELLQKRQSNDQQLTMKHKKPVNRVFAEEGWKTFHSRDNGEEGARSGHGSASLNAELSGHHDGGICENGITGARCLEPRAPKPFFRKWLSAATARKPPTKE